MQNADVCFSFHFRDDGRLSCITAQEITGMSWEAVGPSIKGVRGILAQLQKKTGDADVSRAKKMFVALLIQTVNGVLSYIPRLVKIEIPVPVFSTGQLQGNAVRPYLN